MRLYQDRIGTFTLRVLRRFEGALLRPVEEKSRRNAWDAVCADRRRAHVRHETSQVLARLAASRAQAASIPLGERQLEHTSSA